MPRFRKKPVEVRAEQWFADDGLLGVFPGVEYDSASGRYYVTTIHGQQTFIADGDWILPEPDGIHFYPVKPDIFEATYEAC